MSMEPSAADFWSDATRNDEKQGGNRGFIQNASGRPKWACEEQTWPPAMKTMQGIFQSTTVRFPRIRIPLMSLRMFPSRRGSTDPFGSILEMASDSSQNVNISNPNSAFKVA
jgi:hypothetical protein